jgi:hypothetical protein
MMLVGALAGVLGVLAILEAALALWYRVTGRSARAAELYLKNEPNAYIRELRALTPNGARYADALFPHPYLGWVYHGNPPSGVSSVNNIGLLGQDFPHERDPTRFTVLLTGGSVANQLGALGKGPRFLEEELNASYATGDGRPFRVLNGGNGAWKQPQQTILFTMFADAVDGVVTLDGCNEHYGLAQWVRLEAPAANFHLMNPLATQSHRQLVGIWLSGLVDRRVRTGRWLSRSYVATVLAYAIRSALYRLLVAPPDRVPKRTSLGTMFALPGDWSREEAFRHNVGSYYKYITAMDAIAADAGAKSAHFVQPAPAIDKVLTDEERRVVGDLGYKPLFQAMERELLQLKRIGVPIFSLTDIFRDVRETMYSDSSHLAFDATGDSPGYRLMAKRMAADLAEAWGLERRRADGGAPA